MINLLINLTLLSTLALHSGALYPSPQEVERVVHRIMKERSVNLLWKAQHNPNFDIWDIDDEGMLNQIGICREASEVLAYDLMHNGYQVWINDAPGHANVGIMVQEGHQYYELIIDPTWRQFLVPAYLLGFVDGKKHLFKEVYQLLEARKIPDVLILDRAAVRLFYDNLQGQLGLIPVWNMTLPHKPQYTFERFYLPTHRSTSQEIWARALMRTPYFQEKQKKRYLARQEERRLTPEFHLFSSAWFQHYFLSLEKKGRFFDYNRNPNPILMSYCLPSVQYQLNP